MDLKLILLMKRFDLNLSHTQEVMSLLNYYLQ